MTEFSMPSTRKLWVTLAAVALAAALAQEAACRRQDARVVEAPEAERVRIGAFMSLTGDTAQYGISALNGIRMAVEEANAAGGAGGRRVELIVQDTRSDVAETGVVVEKLAREERVHALLGEVVSSRSLAAAHVAQRERVPVLTPSATSPDVTAAGDYVFRS
ncbi:MAG TPA: ABC transporter substrate-binding protein, partial [Pyrinomonadaceae bacterium]